MCLSQQWNNCPKLAYSKCTFPSCYSSVYINKIPSLCEIMTWKTFKKSSYRSSSWTTHIVVWNKHSAGITSRYKSSDRELNHSPKMPFSLTFCLQITCHPDCWFCSYPLCPAFVSTVVPLCSFHGIASSTAGSQHILQLLGNLALQNWFLVKWRILNGLHFAKVETEVQTG